MVEKKLKKKKHFRSKYELFRSLQRKVMYPTITAILDYLEESNKIAYKKDGSIIWIFKGSSKSKRRIEGIKTIQKTKRKVLKI